MSGTSRVLCNCEDKFCFRTVTLPSAVADEIRSHHHMVIVDGCRKGPSKTDELIERRLDYSLYREMQTVH